MHLTLIYDFIDKLIQLTDIYICIFITLVWPHPACTLTVTKRKGLFCNLVFFKLYKVSNIRANTELKAVN